MRIIRVGERDGKRETERTRKGSASGFAVFWRWNRKFEESWEESWKKKQKVRKTLAGMIAKLWKGWQLRWDDSTTEFTSAGIVELKLGANNRSWREPTEVGGFEGTSATLHQFHHRIHLNNNDQFSLIIVIRIWMLETSSAPSDNVISIQMKPNFIKIPRFGFYREK